MKKTILWDNDGVLVDTEKYYLEANTIFLKDYGIEVTEELYNRISLRKGKSMLTLLADKGYPEEEILKLREQRDDIYIDLVMSNDITIAGAGDVLASLNGKFKMGVVTTTKREYFTKVHEGTGFLKYFGFIVAREDYKKAKPSPDPYLLGISRSQSRPEECVAIEDTERGLKSALSAGLDCIVIPSGLTKKNKFKDAKIVFSSISDVTSDVIMSL
jgi:HAD superfamily hydrolase (TIGR01509 family)